MDTDKIIVSRMLDVMLGHNVKNVVCSPGSRNIPLLIGLDKREDFRKFIAVDERSAAFMALGISQLHKSPVALVCTSGTALLNYAPAVAEAYYQGLPLIIISADRPKEWIDQDDSQTIRQFGVLDNIVKGSYDISDRDCDEDGLWYAERICNEALLTAMRPKEGPVHINIHLAAPLQGRSDDSAENIRKIENLSFKHLPSRVECRGLASRLVDKKVLLVAGFMTPNAILNRHVSRFVSHPNVAIMAETISNLHLKPEAYVIDPALCRRDDWDAEEAAELAPDIVISIGGALISRMLKEYLRECAAKNRKMEHWHIDESAGLTDTFKCLSIKIEREPASILGAISAEMAHIRKNRVISGCPHAKKSGSLEYSVHWERVKSAAHRLINDGIRKSAWSEIKAYDHIFSHFPASTNLQISNGTAIRYHQILAGKIPHAVFCNRGVSGIEGSTSTALGNSLASKLPVILVTGDMSASYDLGGLLAASELSANLKIIVINNHGGGIFRFIRATRDWEGREDYLCSGTVRDFYGISESFGFNYLRADSFPSLKTSMQKLMSADGKGLLEVIVPPEESSELLIDILNQR